MTKNRPDARRAIALSLGVILVLAACLAAPQTRPGPQPPPLPSEDHKCPVCGMFVKGYPGFLAAVVFRDGATVFFDGCKDMFRYLFDVGTFAPGRTRADVAAVWVTDYYSQKWTDGSQAVYVRGSDVLGPMGRELIPFAKDGEAGEFVKDHKGDALLRFAEVTPDIVKALD